MALIKPYCNSLTVYSRFLTREVKVGNIGIGGSNPIRIQSMTTTDTMDTEKTVEQSIRMIEAGCELVRITAPSMNEARNLERIKNELRKRGYITPLVADIHFTPNAAEEAARIVEKVRVNPGNYADKKKFEHIDYSDSSYEAEVDRIRKRFSPLVKICKEYGTAMRIGTNHGSLSDRILSRYGDTPEGMVESAMEFLLICEEQNYHDIILSMKASNTRVMVQAYRLLVQRMMEKGQNYPLHLGVTEAGEGEDGRIKSAAGIGTLLEDGLGDTIRVSLTEEPELEIPVARDLVARYPRKPNNPVSLPEVAIQNNQWDLPYDPYTYQKRVSTELLHMGGEQVPRVVADFSKVEKITPASLFACGYTYSPALDKWHISDQAADFIYIEDHVLDFELPGTLKVIYAVRHDLRIRSAPNHYPIVTYQTYLGNKDAFTGPVFAVTYDPLLPIEELDPNVILVLNTGAFDTLASLRRVFILLEQRNIPNPVMILWKNKEDSAEKYLLNASTDLGGLLLDGFGDAIMLQNDSVYPAKDRNALAFGILQASRCRISKTEYISCPSCGRTLFDLQETTAKIRSRTSHLKGVKIGIMGCIVNGPGEMADADYGYVGTGVGKITLYKGKEVVERNIDSEKAVDALIELIRKHGDWVEMVDIKEAL
ncbi:MAG: (E)-4-hydroxy-3-methylbut-2-enyl-diphosphate synthase [Bacteroidia bacterium]